MKYKRYILLFFFFPLLILSVFYFLFKDFTETEVIQPHSVVAWARVPELLQQENLSSIGRVESYKYWPQDGTTFSAMEARMIVKGDRNTIESKLKKYFLAKGFKEDEEHKFWKGDQQFHFFIEKQDDANWLVYLSLMDFYR